MSQSQSSFTCTSSQSSATVSYKKRSRNGNCINAKIVESNYTRVSMNDYLYKCNICGIQRKQKDKSGHGNLISHLNLLHKDIMNKQLQVACNQPTLDVSDTVFMYQQRF